MRQVANFDTEEPMSRKSNPEVLPVAMLRKLDALGRRGNKIVTQLLGST